MQNGACPYFAVRSEWCILSLFLYRYELFVDCLFLSEELPHRRAFHCLDPHDLLGEPGRDELEHDAVEERAEDSDALDPSEPPDEQVARMGQGRRSCLL